MQVMNSTFIEYLLCARLYAIYLEQTRVTNVLHLLKAGKGILDDEQLFWQIRGDQDPIPRFVRC